jgi:uncharacterized protein YjdB
MPKAYSTINTVLKAGETFAELEQLCKIKSYPDLGGAPENLETTDLEDENQTFVSGVQSLDQMEFTCNYTDEAYEDVLDAAGIDQYYMLEMGDGGEQGRFIWYGQHSVRVTGGDVNAVREMVITVTPSSEIVKVPLTVTPKSATVKVGSTVALTADAPSGASVSWSSSDSTKASVSNGTVTGAGVGTATITASITVDNEVTGSGTITYTDTALISVVSAGT